VAGEQDGDEAERGDRLPSTWIAIAAVAIAG
jgi:hypothetical protein